jgi:hypothetical protein
LQGYNESCLKSSFRKFYGHSNDIVCHYKLSLAHILNDLFHTLCYTINSILASTTGNPVYLLSLEGSQQVWPVSRGCLLLCGHPILPLHLFVSVLLCTRFCICLLDYDYVLYNVHHFVLKAIARDFFFSCRSFWLNSVSHEYKHSPLTNVQNSFTWEFPQTVGRPFIFLTGTWHVLCIYYHGTRLTAGVTNRQGMLTSLRNLIQSPIYAVVCVSPFISLTCVSRLITISMDLA